MALALPALVLVLGVVTATGKVVQAQLQCTDAARAAARQAARGESTGTVLNTARSAGPGGASAVLARTGSQIRVDVRAAVRLPLPGAPSLPVRAHAVADVEQP